MTRIHITSEREQSELARWRDEGFRREPTTSNIVTYGSPDRQYNISVEVDDPVEGYLVKLYRRDGDVLGRAIVEGKDLATELAHEFAAYPDRYEGLDSWVATMSNSSDSKGEQNAAIMEENAPSLLDTETSSNEADEVVSTVAEEISDTLTQYDQRLAALERQLDEQQQAQCPVIEQREDGSGLPALWVAGHPLGKITHTAYVTAENAEKQVNRLKDRLDDFEHDECDGTNED